MDYQQMTREVATEYNNVLPDNAFNGSNTIWDQSAKIVAAIMDNANYLPDDSENKTDNGVPAYNNKRHETYIMDNKAKTQLQQYSLAELQEEHALWLK